MNFDFSKTLNEKQKYIKNNLNNVPFTLQNKFVNNLSTEDFLNCKYILPKDIFDKTFELYNTSALKIQRFFTSRTTFEYGRKWRYISWDYLKNNSDKRYNLLCSVSAKYWKPLDFITQYDFCFQKSGGCPYYPRVCFFCSCPNGECLDHLEQFIFKNSLKIIL